MFDDQCMRSHSVASANAAFQRLAHASPLTSELIGRRELNRESAIGNAFTLPPLRSNELLGGTEVDKADSYRVNVAVCVNESGSDDRV